MKKNYFYFVVVLIIVCLLLTFLLAVLHYYNFLSIVEAEVVNKFVTRSRFMGYPLPKEILDSVPYTRNFKVGGRVPLDNRMSTIIGVLVGTQKYTGEEIRLIMTLCDAEAYLKSVALTQIADNDPDFFVTLSTRDHIDLWFDYLTQHMEYPSRFSNLECERIKRAAVQMWEVAGIRIVQT